MSQPFDNRDYDVQQLMAKDAEIKRLRVLITELADCLEAYTPDAEGGYREAKALIQEAREVVK